MAKLTEIDSSKPIILLGVNKSGDTATLIDRAEAWVGDSAGFIELMKASKFSQALESNLRDVSKMSEDGNVLTTRMNIADFREMVSTYDEDLVDRAEKWQHLGANEVHIDGHYK